MLPVISQRQNKYGSFQVMVLYAARPTVCILNNKILFYLYITLVCTYRVT